MNWRKRVIFLALSIVMILANSTVVAAKRPPAEPTATLLVTGLEELQGSTVGPGRDLYVTAPLAGSIWRVDPKTGDVALFATGLPPRNPDPFFMGAGVIDVAFLDKTAYALVTGVASDLGGDDIVGVYRMDAPDSFSVVADIGAFSLANPPEPEFFVPTGFQYAIQTFQGKFLVTDAHHNRVLSVTRDGDISEVITFANLVPTGLALRGNKVFMGQAGPIPHLPEDSRVVSFTLKSPVARQVASGAGLSNIGLLVDVEFGPGGKLYALLQGHWDGPYEGSPADPNTGALAVVNRDGSLTILIDGLNQPTSFEFIGNNAYVVTLTGEVWKIENISARRTKKEH